MTVNEFEAALGRSGSGEDEGEQDDAATEKEKDVLPDDEMIGGGDVPLSRVRGSAGD